MNRTRSIILSAVIAISGMASTVGITHADGRASATTAATTTSTVTSNSYVPYFGYRGVDCAYLYRTYFYWFNYYNPQTFSDFVDFFSNTQVRRLLGLYSIYCR